VISIVLIVAGLTMLIVSYVRGYWLLGQYEARIAALEAQLRLPCPTCHVAATGLGKAPERS
jgi:hypothetical protein